MKARLATLLKAIAVVSATTYLVAPKKASKHTNLEFVRQTIGELDASAIYNTQPGCRPLGQLMKVRRTYVKGKDGQSTLDPALVKWYGARTVSLADVGINGVYSHKDLREGLLQHFQQQIVFWQAQ